MTREVARFLSFALLEASMAWAQSGIGLTSPSEQSDKPTQVSSGTARYDLSQCVQYALNNNNRSKVSRDSIDMAVAIHKQALSSWWPQVSGRVTGARMDEDPNFIFPSTAVSVPAGTLALPPTTIRLPANSFGPGFPPVDLPITIPPMSVNVPAQTIPIPQQDIKLMNRDSLVGSLNVMFPVYTGGLRGSRIKQAKFGLEAAEHDNRKTDLEVVYDVKRLYHAAVLSQQLLQIGEDTLARMEATLDLTEKLYKTGSGTVKKTDYLRNKAVVETLRSMVQELDAKKKTVLATLITVMGMEWNSEILLADTEIPFSPGEWDPQQFVDRAFKSNPDIAKVEAAVKAAESGVNAARSGHFPKVALFGTTQRIWNSYDAGIVTAVNKSNWTVGIGVDIPIFEGFRISNQEKEARANLQKLQHQLALLRQGIAMEIKNTCLDLLKTQKQQKSTFDAFQAAKENRELNVRAYQEELVETKDVIEAQIMEALFSGQHQKALYDHVEARAKLDFVSGSEAGQLPPGRK